MPRSARDAEEPAMNEQPNSPAGPGAPLTAFLWITAAALAVLVVARLGQISLGPSAQAEMVSQSGDFTIMTTNGGNDDIVAVLDNRSEDLAVYRVENQSAFELYQRVPLQRVFTDARARSKAG